MCFREDRLRKGGEKYLFKTIPTWIGRLRNIQLVIVIGEVSFDTLNLSCDEYNNLKDKMRSVSRRWALVR